MAHKLAGLLSMARPLSTCRVELARLQQCRRFSVSSGLLQRQRPGLDERRRVSVLEEDPEELFESFEDDGTPEIVDAPSGAHMVLQRERELLHYLRLIEHEMPKLVAYRKPFVPPSSETPLIVRSVHYQSEEHPVARKRVIVVPVDALPLKGDVAIHKFKLLAGPRWTPEAPKGAGVGLSEETGNGYLKISCEDFPHAGANLKWVSDTLNRLVVEANDTKDTFNDVPIDFRHVYAKAKKEKKGRHIRDRVFSRPSIRDFPKEWLPEQSA